MDFVELLHNMLESFTSLNTTECTNEDLPTGFPKTLKPATNSDILDCGKAHEKIERGDCKKISPFVNYTELVNEEQGRKTIAGTLYIPFVDTIRGCISANEIKKPKDTGLKSQADGC
jgi:hypothetical protein